MLPGVGQRSLAVFYSSALSWGQLSVSQCCLQNSLKSPPAAESCSSGLGSGPEGKQKWRKLWKGNKATPPLCCCRATWPQRVQPGCAGLEGRPRAAGDAGRAHQRYRKAALPGARGARGVQPGAAGLGEVRPMRDGRRIALGSFMLDRLPGRGGVAAAPCAAAELLASGASGNAGGAGGTACWTLC